MSDVTAATGRGEFTVRAFWDAEAAVWVAESEDVPGLITEADTVEQLLTKLAVMVPELLEANGVILPNDDDSDIPFTFLAETQVRARRRAS